MLNGGGATSSRGGLNFADAEVRVTLSSIRCSSLVIIALMPPLNSCLKRQIAISTDAGQTETSYILTKANITNSQP